MSRIGKKKILIPTGVTVTVDKSKVDVKGPKGNLSIEIRPEIAAAVEKDQVIVSVAKETKDSSAFWGLTRALIANMVKGVAEGYEKKLQLIGVGYRAKVSGDVLTLTVGYSHPIEFKAPQGIEISMEENQIIVVRGIDKHLVGLVAAQIRKIKKPEPYKGKGIRYIDEVVRRKAGKSGKV